MVSYGKGSVQKSCLNRANELRWKTEARQQTEAGKETALVPVYGSEIKDGSYEVEVKSSSSMFRIVKAILKVENGVMTADLTLSGTGYLKLFMGIRDEALEAEEESYIPYVEDEDGAYTYTIPVEALNMEFSCAAYSKRKEQWYDRQLMISAASLPESAVVVETANLKADSSDLLPVQTQIKDGDYTIEISLNGGTGKASVSSPAHLRIFNGKATVSIVWSSSNFDYMTAGGKKYLPEYTEEHSVFEIPVSVLAQEMEISADTVAMSRPHEIPYTLIFHWETLRKETNPSIVIILVAVAGASLAAAALILKFTEKHKRKKRDEEE